VNRLLAILPSVVLLAACEVTFTSGQPVNTKEIARTSTEMLKAKGVDVQTITCPDDFAYRKGHETLLCQATVVGGLVVDAPITFHDATHFNVKLDLPEVTSVHASDMVELSRKTYGQDVVLACPTELVFWKGKDAVTCQMTVEGETRDIAITRRDGRVHVVPSVEHYYEATWLETIVTSYFHDRMSLEAKVDCGQPRLALKKVGRKVECGVSWEGGRARIVAKPDATGARFTVVETEGLRAAQLEVVLTKYVTPAAGNSWSCREGTQIVRGQPFSCDFVTAGRKRTRTKILLDGDESSATFTPPVQQ
jgi:hypothetical protein